MIDLNRPHRARKQQHLFFDEFGESILGDAKEVVRFVSFIAIGLFLLISLGRGVLENIRDLFVWIFF